MTLFDEVVEASRLFSRAEEAFFDDYFADDLTDEELARLWLVADEWRRSVDGLVKLIADEWVARGVWVEVDGFKVGHKKGYTRERCIDPESFLTWLTVNPDQIEKVLNPNNVKFGSLPSAVRDTFFEKETVVKPDAIEQPAAIPVAVLEAKK